MHCICLDTIVQKKLLRFHVNSDSFEMMSFTLNKFTAILPSVWHWLGCPMTILGKVYMTWKFYLVFGILVMWNNWLRPEKLMSLKNHFWCVFSRSKHANISVKQDSLGQKHTYFLTKWNTFYGFQQFLILDFFCYKYVSNKKRKKNFAVIYT